MVGAREARHGMQVMRFQGQAPASTTDHGIHRTLSLRCIYLGGSVEVAKRCFIVMSSSGKERGRLETDDKRKSNERKRETMKGNPYMPSRFYLIVVVKGTSEKQTLS